MEKFPTIFNSGEQRFLLHDAKWHAEQSYPREKGIYPAKQGEYHLRMKSWQCECSADGGGGDKTYVRP